MLDNKPVLWLDAVAVRALLFSGSEDTRNTIRRVLPEVYDLKMTDVVYDELIRASAFRNVNRKLVNVTLGIRQKEKTDMMKQVRRSGEPIRDAGEISIKEVFDKNRAGEKDKICSDDRFFKDNGMGSCTLSVIEVANTLLVANKGFGPEAYTNFITALEEHYPVSRNIGIDDVPNWRIPYLPGEAALAHSGVPVASFVTRVRQSRLFQSKLEHAVLKLIEGLEEGEEASVSMGKSIKNGRGARNSKDEEIIVTARILPAGAELLPTIHQTIRDFLNGKKHQAVITYGGKRIELNISDMDVERAPEGQGR